MRDRWSTLTAIIRRVDTECINCDHLIEVTSTAEAFRGLVDCLSVELSDRCPILQ